MKKTYSFLLLVFVFWNSYSQVECITDVFYTTQTLSVVTANGEIYTYGKNTFGQIGKGDTQLQNTPWLRPETPHFVSISHGFISSSGLTSDGKIYTWGANLTGVLGDGTTNDSYTPIQVGTDSDWVKVVNTWVNNIAIKSDGTLWGWGNNLNCALVPADSNYNFYPTPIPLSSDTNWVDIAAGAGHTFAIKSDGTLWARGKNTNYVLGLPISNGSCANFTQVGTDTDWKKVSTSNMGYYTLALKTDNTLWGWGDNIQGAVGNGVSELVQTPIQIGTDNWTDIAAGEFIATGIKSDGTLWGWGKGGWIGSVVFPNTLSPVQLGIDSDWIKVAAGYVGTFALKSDNTLWGWGIYQADFNEDGSFDTYTASTTIPELIYECNNNPVTVNLDIQNLCFGDATSFSFSSSVENPDNIHWDFGDGNTSNETSPQHTYTQPQTYLVTLTVEWEGMTYSTNQTITIFPVPVAHTPADITLCENEYNLLQQNSIILGTQPSQLYQITYHQTLSDAETANNAITSPDENTTNSQTIWARITHIDTGCYDITTFQIKIIPELKIEMESLYYLCDNSPISITAPSGFDSYLWSTEETSPTITLTEAGSYTLTVLIGDCSAVKEFTVTALPEPVINYININDWNDSSNSINIYTLEEGVYEYSIDGIIYQSENYFMNLPFGVYKVYVRNICGIASENVTLFTYPKYFTPNGDGIHDFWRIPFGIYEPEMKISIFDRYGKLIKVFYGKDMGWDGTYNAQQLPATDYWFLVVRQDGRIHKGHFSLKR